MVSFNRPEMVKPIGVSTKRVITNKEILSIVDLKEFDSPAQKYARDIWLFLYRCNGINFVDLLRMRWSNIEGNR